MWTVNFVKTVPIPSRKNAIAAVAMNSKIIRKEKIKKNWKFPIPSYLKENQKKNRKTIPGNENSLPINSLV